MKIQYIVAATAAAASLGAGFAAFAQTTYERAPAIVSIERIYVQPANYGPYHGGFVTESDAQLLSDAIGVLASDRSLSGSIVTVVANRGELVVNGSATPPQAARIESKLKGLPGVTHVSAWFSPLGS